MRTETSITSSTTETPTITTPIKKILLGITGGIAAYKAAELIRLCKRDDVDVKVVMTEAAQEFITPLTLRTLSCNTVYTDMFPQKLNIDASNNRNIGDGAAGKNIFKNTNETNNAQNNPLKHIELSRWADAVLIAPATANIIAKLAHGIADDLLTTLCLATAVPLFVAPAMNQQMWNHASTQCNINILRARDAHILGPATGIQACGDVGVGRMLEPDELWQTLKLELKKVKEKTCSIELKTPTLSTDYSFDYSSKKFLSGYKVIVTAGATREKIDEVRYLSNYSSGKMGYALAKAAQTAGAAVTLISAPTNLIIEPEFDINVIHTASAQDMHDAVMSEMREIREQKKTIFIAAAAVADFRPTKIYAHKLKREALGEKMTVDLERTPDILAAVATQPNPPLTIGFAAETENLALNAQQKLLRKGVDMIVANKVGFNTETQQPIGFDSDDNEVMIFSKNEKAPIKLPSAPKTIIAEKLLQIIYEKL